MAVIVASVAMVFFILPAELGIDLTGFGEKTGLTGLAKSGSGNIYLDRGLKRTNVLFPLDAAAKPDEATLRATLAAKGIAIPANAKFVSDHWEYELLPYDSIEMKYKLAQGQPMIFSWHAPRAGPLRHAFGARPGRQSRHRKLRHLGRARPDRRLRGAVYGYPWVVLAEPDAE